MNDQESGNKKAIVAWSVQAGDEDLEHEDERRSIAEETYRFVTRELTISRTVGRVLEGIRERRRMSFQPAGA